MVNCSKTLVMIQPHIYLPFYSPCPRWCTFQVPMRELSCSTDKQYEPTLTYKLIII